MILIKGDLMNEDYEIEFLTVKQFAKKMNLSEQVIRLWIKKGKIKGMKISSGKKSPFRIPNSELSRLHEEVYTQ